MAGVADHHAGNARRGSPPSSRPGCAILSQTLRAERRARANISATQLGEIAKANPEVAIGSYPFFDPQHGAPTPMWCLPRPRRAKACALPRGPVEDMLQAGEGVPSRERMTANAVRDRRRPRHLASKIATGGMRRPRWPFIYYYYPTRRGLLAREPRSARPQLVLDDAFAQAACPDARNATTAVRRPSGRRRGPISSRVSPQRADLVEPGSKARLVELSGQVLTRSLRPGGFRRSSMCGTPTEARRIRQCRLPFIAGTCSPMIAGRYPLSATILPALYTPAALATTHVKVQAPPAKACSRRQLYFPDEPMNRRDGPPFRRELFDANGRGRATRSRHGSISCSTCARTLFFSVRGGEDGAKPRSRTAATAANRSNRRRFPSRGINSTAMARALAWAASPAPGRSRRSSA